MQTMLSGKRLSWKRRITCPDCKKKWDLSQKEGTDSADRALLRNDYLYDEEEDAEPIGSSKQPIQLVGDA